ncbi:MAG: hypothetical protein AB7E04_12885 [Desulfobacteraceae bacterium]
MESEKLNLFLNTIKKINKLNLRILKVQASVNFYQEKIDDFFHNFSDRAIQAREFAPRRYELTVFNVEKGEDNNRSLMFYDFDSLEKHKNGWETALKLIKQDDFQIIKNNFSQVRDSVN